jgi:hypothetical protein
MRHTHVYCLPMEPIRSGSMLLREERCPCGDRRRTFEIVDMEMFTREGIASLVDYIDKITQNA